MKKYFIGTPIHKQQNIMTELSEEAYKMHYLNSETYHMKCAKAKGLPQAKKVKVLTDAEVLQDFVNGMFIGEVVEIEESK